MQFSATTAKPRPTAPASLDAQRVRRDFPILSRKVNGRPLVYLDNAATSQKPQCVIDALVAYYSESNANIHRGVHELSLRATEQYEQTRRKVRAFINAARVEEIVFTRGATEGVNLVAQTHARSMLKPGDEILITTLEHHSNIVPWQILCQQTGAVLKVAPINDRGELLLDDFRAMLSSCTRLAAFTHVSNALGTINPVREMTALAKAAGATVLIDGAQAAPHLRIDVQGIGCDFYVLSSHKMFGPTGVGVLYGRYDLLNAMPPYQGGGEMIKSVTFERTIYNEVPHKFEAGTPNIADTVAFVAAIDYLESHGLESIATYEHELLEYGTKALAQVPGLRLIGTAAEKAAVLSFVIEGIHPHDLGTILDQQGIAVRTGQHCAQPIMDRFGIPATVRASLAFYNTRAEIDALVAALHKAVEVFR